MEDSLSIVKAMGEYLQRYKSFRDIIAPQLQETADIDGDIFTSHGYSHCVRIFRQLNNLLEDHEPFFAEIKEEELFCLGLAVLLHDLIMTKQPELRMSHSVEAQKTIRKEFEGLKDSFLTINLSDSVVDAIADIVYAHSDVKDKNGNITEKTLEVVMEKIEQGESGTIRTHILAALLRFGDELDCTSARTNDCQKLVDKTKVSNNSHWRKCALIRGIQPPGPSRTNIELKINDFILRESDDKDNDLKHIYQVLEKLTKSLIEVNVTVFEHNNVKWWHFNSVKLTTDSEKIIESFSSQNPLSVPLVTPEKVDSTIVNGDSGALVQKLNKETEDVESLDKSMSKQIKAWVLEGKMLMSGHFCVTKERHARDWLDTSRLLENKEYLGLVANSFINILNQRGLNPENTVLIGEGFPGLIIASQIGFVGGFGCTYMLSAQDGELPEIPDNKGLVLVTDVVAVGETLKESLGNLEKDYKIKSDRVTAILTVFYRKPLARPSILNGISDKLIALNTDFPIEFCEKAPKDCLLSSNGLVKVINEDLEKN